MARADRLAPEGDWALWATALYAGSRRDELGALRWEDIDLSTGVIRAERSYSFVTGEVVTRPLVA